MSIMEDSVSAIDSLMQVLRTSHISLVSVSHSGWIAYEPGRPTESGVSGKQLSELLKRRELPETVNVKLSTELIAEINEAKGLDIKLLYKIQDALAKG